MLTNVILEHLCFADAIFVGKENTEHSEIKQIQDSQICYDTWSRKVKDISLGQIYASILFCHVQEPITIPRRQKYVTLSIHPVSKCCKLQSSFLVVHKKYCYPSCTVSSYGVCFASIPWKESLLQQLVTAICGGNSPLYLITAHCLSVLVFTSLSDECWMVGRGGIESGHIFDDTVQG